MGRRAAGVAAVAAHLLCSTFWTVTNTNWLKMQQPAADGAPRDEARANTYVDQWFLGCVREVPRARVAGSSAADVPTLSSLRDLKQKE